MIHSQSRSSSTISTACAICQNIIASVHPLLLVLFFWGCGVPRIPIKQTFDHAATIESAGSRVHVYQARDPRALDSTARILRMEYQPVTIYAVADARDSIEQLVVVSWQQLLWRFSERLSATDKAYFAPIPMSFARSADTAVMTWAYPSLDTRDDDLKRITPYRNSYWTVDTYTMTSEFDEVFRGDIRSFPQFDPYNPLKRFEPGGAYDRAHADTLAVYTALRRYLETRTASDADTARR